MSRQEIVDWLIIVAIFMVLSLLISLWHTIYHKWEDNALEMPLNEFNGTSELFLRSDLPPCHIETADLGYRTVTAYSSTPEETDDTPFITASGLTVRDGIVATNELAFGTLVKIDGRVYEVQDRTNVRYHNLYDVWMPSKQEALDWGKRTLKIELAY